VVFNGMTVSGTWKLFLADMSGGNQSTVNSWSLDIAGVPEPVGCALGILGGIFLVIQAAGSRPVRIRVGRWRVAVGRWIDAV
jgi:hypothetical protein